MGWGRCEYYNCGSKKEMMIAFWKTCKKLYFASSLRVNHGISSHRSTSASIGAARCGAVRGLVEAKGYPRVRPHYSWGLIEDHIISPCCGVPGNIILTEGSLYWIGKGSVANCSCKYANVLPFPTNLLVHRKFLNTCAKISASTSGFLQSVGCFPFCGVGFDICEYCIFLHMFIYSTRSYGTSIFLCRHICLGLLPFRVARESSSRVPSFL